MIAGLSEGLDGDDLDFAVEVSVEISKTNAKEAAWEVWKFLDRECKKHKKEEFSERLSQLVFEEWYLDQEKKG